MPPWGVFGDEQEREQHIVPLDDLKEHEIHRFCWCRPVATADDDDVLVHNSLDGREQFETGSRKLS